VIAQASFYVKAFCDFHLLRKTEAPTTLLK
jgi:hypothetical protein